MVAGSDLLRYLLSVSGAIALMFGIALWLRARPTSRSARQALLAAALAFGVLSIYAAQYVVARLVSAGFKPFTAADAAADRRTAIVVLGSGSMDVEDWSGRTFSVVDPAAATRVLEASRVFTLIDPAIVISSGGIAQPDSIRRPTGETMRDALVILGVPPDRILVETMSRTTRDEALVVAPMLAAQSIGQTILVTSQTHMRRALGTFRAVGIRAIPAVAQELDRHKSLTEWMLPSETGLDLASSNAHETIGLAYYWLRGWWRR
jgi:uncharacterized SAM-binding protein YcdF (DUF218 family)